MMNDIFSIVIMSWWIRPKERERERERLLVDKDQCFVAGVNFLLQKV